MIALPFWVQEEDNLPRDLFYSQLCSTPSQGLSAWRIDEHARFPTLLDSTGSLLSKVRHFKRLLVERLHK
jgi:hypothetical protein